LKSRGENLLGCLSLANGFWMALGSF